MTARLSKWQPRSRQCLHSISLHEAGSGEFASFAPCFPAFKEDAMYIFLFFFACLLFFAGLLLVYLGWLSASDKVRVIGILIAACGLAILVFH